MDEALRADGRRNRAAILDAAAGLVEETGHAPFTELARRAGVTRATIYRHFPDQDSLIAALARELTAALIPPVLAEMEALPLAEAWRQLATMVADTGRAHRLLLAALGASTDEAARIAVTDEPIRDFLARRRLRGDLTNDLPDLWLAQCIRALCVASLGRTDLPADEQADLLARSLIRLTAT